MSDIITVREKLGVKVSEYKGNYKLVSCYNGYEQWGKYKVSKDAYSEKDRPIAVELGDKEGALSLLRKLYAEISGGVPF